jgi:hypothetical protein
MASQGNAGLSEGLVRGALTMNQLLEGRRREASLGIVDQMNLMKLGEAQKEIDNQKALGQQMSEAQARGDFTATPAGPLTADTATMTGTTFLGDTALPTGTLTESTPAMPAETTPAEVASKFWGKEGDVTKMLAYAKEHRGEMKEAFKDLVEISKDKTGLTRTVGWSLLQKLHPVFQGLSPDQFKVDPDNGVVEGKTKSGLTYLVDHTGKITPMVEKATPQPTEMGARVAAALKPGGPEDIALTRKQQEELDKEKGKATTSANKEAERDARTKKEDQLKAATADWKLKTQRIKEYSTKKSKAEAVRQKAWDAKNKDAQAVAETNFKETMKGLYEDYADLWPSDEGAPTPAKAAQPPAGKTKSGKDYWVWPDGKAYYEPPKG